MSNLPLNTDILDRAILFAVQAHSGTERRGKGFPYIVHPMEAVSIVATMTSDQELLAAAALHDTVEDTDVSIDDIRSEFGDKVADIVSVESDRVIDGVSEEKSWKIRKQEAMDKISSSSKDAKIVAMGDKLSNLRAIWRDYQTIGNKVWDLFKVKDRASHEWHYRGLANSLSALSDTFAYKEFMTLLDSLFGQETTFEPIDMDDYERSGDGFTAESYNCKDGRTMMKLYASFVPESIPVHELKIAREIEKMGLRIPKAYKLVTDGSRVGVVFERIQNKKSYARAISDNPESLDEYSRRFAVCCRKLHETECNTAEFQNVKDFYFEIIKESKDFSDTEKESLIKAVMRVPDATTCLHGDMHIGNLLTTGKEDVWIDLSDFRYGDPLFDVGAFYFLMNVIPGSLVEKLFHIDGDQGKRCWESFAAEYFGEKRSIEEINAQMLPYAAISAIYFSTKSGLRPEMRDLIDNTLLA